MEAITDTLNTLQRLGKFRKGIITNGSITQQNEKLDVLGIRDYFDSVIISEEAGVAKPDFKIFELACDQLKCNPEDCYLVGDNWELDVVGSYKAGMRPVWINHYEKDVPEKLNGVIVIKSLGELETIVNRNYKQQ